MIGCRPVAQFLTAATLAERWARAIAPSEVGQCSEVRPRLSPAVLARHFPHSPAQRVVAFLRTCKSMQHAADAAINHGTHKVYIEATIHELGLSPNTPPAVGSGARIGRG